jgi:multiple sugar transport system permease protein
MRNRKRVGWHKYINLVTVSTLVTVLFVIIPLYWLVATSFKNPNSIGTFNGAGSLGPRPFSTENYYNAFVNYDFGIYFKTSIIVTFSTTALVLILGTLAGYALGRLPMRGKFTTMVTLLIISVFPSVAVINSGSSGGRTLGETANMVPNHLPAPGPDCPVWNRFGGLWSGS